MSEQFDVLIAGGGVAGASAGVRLAKQGLRVMIVERKTFPRPKLCGEFISPECLTHFQELGVYEQMRAAGAREISETVFYTPAGREVCVPSIWFGARSACALGLSRAAMDWVLLKRAQEAGVRVVEDCQVGDVLIEGGVVRGVRIKTHGEQSLDADCEVRACLTIDATGRGSLLARRAARHAFDLPKESALSDVKHRPATATQATHVAFKAHFKDVPAIAGRCEIYFYPGGYGGLNEVENELVNLCFIVRAEDARQAASDADRLVREVLMQHNERAAEALAQATRASDWLAVAIERFGRSEVAPAPGLLSVGDAASFIDPFTGSGMLMAFESGTLLAEVIGAHAEIFHPSTPHAESKLKSLMDVQQNYRLRYKERFDKRLRHCSSLRRAAFAPAWLTEAAAIFLGANTQLRRSIARGTRGSFAPQI